MARTSSPILSQNNIAKKLNQTKYTTSSVDESTKPRKSSIYHFPVAILRDGTNRKHKNTLAKVHAHDILCGRGGHANKHPGNIAFRALVEQNQELYVQCNKIGKILVSKSIVEAIFQQSPAGRFLVLDNKIKMWREVQYKVAMKKTSQAIRDVLSKQQTNGSSSSSSSKGASVLPWNDLVHQDLPAYVTSPSYVRKETTPSYCNNKQIPMNNHLHDNHEDHEPLPLHHEMGHSYREYTPIQAAPPQESVYVTPSPTDLMFDIVGPSLEDILSTEVSDEEISLLENEGVVEKQAFQSTNNNDVRDCSSVSF